MSSPIVSSRDLEPLASLVFRKRFRVLVLFIAGTVLTYTVLKVFKVATYESTAVVMVKIPLIDFDARVDPNPQVAPAYLGLAVSEGVLAETHRIFVELRKLADPIRREIGFEEHITKDLREGWLPELKGRQGLISRLEEAASGLDRDWKKEIFSDPGFFLALFEIDPEHIEKIPLFLMKESFKVRTGIAAQTNVSILNEPFLKMKVTWSSPGAAALWANIWSRYFVDRANELTVEAGLSTEDSILGEARKIENELTALQGKLAEKRSRPEYQKLLEVQGLENALYGGKATLDLFGYVEAHANLSKQSGLTGELGRLEIERAAAAGELKGLRKRLGEVQEASSELIRRLREQISEAETEVHRLTAQVEETRTKIGELSSHAADIHREISGFEAEYKHLQFQIQQVTRIFSEKLTTSIFSRSRLKAGYAIPPLVFVEPAVPDKHPAGPPRIILSLAVGALLALFYLCWVIYRYYLTPALGRHGY